MSVIEPEFECIEIVSFSGGVVRTIAQCLHANAVPVRLDDETQVASLCTDCDSQLPHPAWVC